MGPSLLVIFTLTAITITSIHSIDPYKVLNVRRGATEQEIRSSYKKLAREWHPDKNKSPDANERFMEISEAYETLIDPQKRTDYDRFGTTSSRASPQHHGNAAHGNFHDPFDFFFGNSGYNFHFSGSQKGTSVTQRLFEEVILPNSHNQPYLIFAYSDFCFACARVEPLWDALAENLQANGFGVGSFSVSSQRRLAHEFGLQEVPALIAVVRGFSLYYSKEWSTRALNEFVRSLLPRNLLIPVDAHSLTSFLKGARADNRVRALIFSRTPLLRHHAPCLTLQERVTCGFVSMSTDGPAVLLQLGQTAPNGHEWLLVFDEGDRPVASLTAREIPFRQMKEILESHQLLRIPRLSSPSIMDDVCPITHRNLCIFLVIRNGEIDALDSFRTLADSVGTRFGVDRLRFAYIDAKSQYDFVRDVDQAAGQREHAPDGLDVMIVWRIDTRLIRIEMLRGAWNVKDTESCQKSLLRHIEALLTSRDPAPITIPMPVVHDESSAFSVAAWVLWSRRQLDDWLLRFVHSRWDSTSIMWITSVLAIIVLIGLQCLMHTSLAKAEASSSSRPRPKGSRPRPNNEPFLVALTSGNYNDLVLSSPPGCQTILAIVTPGPSAKRNEFARQLGEALGPFRHSMKSFNVATIFADSTWLQRLHPSVSDQCATGSILILNGHARSLAVFTRNEDHFLAMEESDFIPSFQNWFEQFLDGSVKRIRLSQWPSFD